MWYLALPIATQLLRAEFVTRDDVLEMMARVPSCEDRRCRPRGPKRIGPDAVEIADAIALVADGTVTGSVRLDAALMATYAEFESDGRKCVGGDWSPTKKRFLSWGAWQERTALSVACTPEKAARWWVVAATKAIGLCGRHPHEERLAVLCSGYCNRATAKARHRYDVAARIAYA